MHTQMWSILQSSQGVSNFPAKSANYSNHLKVQWVRLRGDLGGSIGRNYILYKYIYLCVFITLEWAFYICRKGRSSLAGVGHVELACSNIIPQRRRQTLTLERGHSHFSHFFVATLKAVKTPDRQKKRRGHGLSVLGVGCTRPCLHFPRDCNLWGMQVFLLHCFILDMCIYSLHINFTKWLYNVVYLGIVVYPSHHLYFKGAISKYLDVIPKTSVPRVADLH